MTTRMTIPYVRATVLAGWLSLVAAAVHGTPSQAQSSQERERVQMAAVHAFLTNGGDPNVRDKLLSVAVYWNQRDAVRGLLEKGANPNLCALDKRLRYGDPGICPISVAVRRDTEILRLLIRAGADVNRAMDDAGYTPLGRLAACWPADGVVRACHESVDEHRGPGPNVVESVRLLIAAGAKLNVMHETGESPLRTAILRRSLDVARLLLEAGADVHQRIGSEHGSAYYGRRGDTILMEALAQYHDLSAIRLLLDHGANPNDRNAPSEVICNGHPDCDFAGQSALTLAIAYGLPEVVELLLDRGADPTLSNARGRTPLQVAQQYRSPDRPKIVALLERYLAQKGPDVLDRERHLAAPRAADTSRAARARPLVGRTFAAGLSTEPNSAEVLTLTRERVTQPPAKICGQTFACTDNVATVRFAHPVAEDQLHIAYLEVPGVSAEALAAEFLAIFPARDLSFPKCHLTERFGSYYGWKVRKFDARKSRSAGYFVVLLGAGGEGGADEEALVAGHLTPTCTFTTLVRRETFYECSIDRRRGRAPSREWYLRCSGAMLTYDIRPDGTLLVHSTAVAREALSTNLCRDVECVQRNSVKPSKKTTTERIDLEALRR